MNCFASCCCQNYNFKSTIFREYIQNDDPANAEKLLKSVENPEILLGSTDSEQRTGLHIVFSIPYAFTKYFQRLHN